MKKRIVLWLVVVVLLFTWQVAQAAVSDTRLATLKAEITDLKAEIAQLKTYNAQLIERLAKLEVKFKEMVDATDKDLQERNRLNQQFGDNVAKANKRIDSTEASYLAFSNRQGALEREQQVLANGYDAATKGVRQKNQIANVPRIQNQERKTQDDPVGQALTMVGLDRGDRGLIYIYARFSRGDNVGGFSGFKGYLEASGREAKFDQIERAAKYLAQDGYLKLGKSQVIRVSRKDPPRILSAEAKSALFRTKSVSVGRSEGSYVKIVQNNNRYQKDIGWEDSDGDGVYTKVDWSFLKRR